MHLTIHIDGGARGNPGPAAAAVVIKREDAPAQLLHEAAYFLGNASNNVAEYKALVRALELALTLKPEQVQLHSDSELMVRQITGQYRVRSPDLLPLFEKAQGLLLKIDSWHIKHVYREANQRADQLVNLSLDAGRDVVVKSIIPGEAPEPPVEPPSKPPQPAAPKAARKGGGPPTIPAPAAAPAPAPGSATSGSVPEHSSRGSIAPAAEGAAYTGPRWIVALDAEPGPSCPAKCRQGQRFIFGPTLPPGLCVHAAQAVLEDICLDPAVPTTRQPRHATCQHCGAKLNLEF